MSSCLSVGKGAHAFHNTPQRIDSAQNHYLSPATHIYKCNTREYLTGDLEWCIIGSMDLETFELVTAALNQCAVKPVDGSYVCYVRPEDMTPETVDLCVQYGFRIFDASGNELTQEVA